MDYMKLFFDLYSEQNIKLKREIIKDIIKNIIINKQVCSIDEFNNMSRKLRVASQISSSEILNIYYNYASKYGVNNSITEFYEKNNRDLLEKEVFNWQQVCRLFKNKYLKIKIITFHINGNHKIADEVIVLSILDIKDVEDASKFCEKNEVIAYTMNAELKF